MEFDRCNGGNRAGDGRTPSSGGHQFVTGLGVHAASDMTFALDDGYAHFSAQAGVDDEVGCGVQQSHSDPFDPCPGGRCCGRCNAR